MRRIIWIFTENIKLGNKSIMKRYTLFLLFVAPLLIIACSTVGDKLLIVSGQLEGVDDCVLRLYKDNNFAIVYEIGVQDNFLIDYTISPKESNYTIQILCKDGDELISVYHGGPFIFGKEVKSQIDLGEITNNKVAEFRERPI